jgi:hypothetical protein
MNGTTLGKQVVYGNSIRSVVYWPLQVFDTQNADEHADKDSLASFHGAILRLHNFIQKREARFAG